MGEEKQWFSLAISDKDLVQNGTLLENRREARSNMSGRDSSDDGYSAEEEMVELTRRSNLGEMSQMLRQSKDESAALPVSSDASGTTEDQNNRLQLTKESKEQWFALEEFNPPTGEHMREKQNAEHLSIHGNTQKPPSSSIEYATSDINSDIFQNTSVPALTSHGQLQDPNSHHVNKITIETCSLEEGRGMVSDTTDNSIVFPNEAMKYASNEQPTTNKMLNEEISNIAAMQRPEPLGKARVEINSKTPLNPAITGLGISTGNKVSGHIGVERAEVGNPGIGNTLTRYRNSGNGNFEKHASSEYGDTANQSEVDDSDEGLKEQAYPVRVPLSVSEGYNGLPTDYKQVMSTVDNPSRDKQERTALDTPDGQQLLTEEFQKTYLDALRNNDDKISQNPGKTEAALQNETRFTSVKRNQEMARTNTDAATPISKLLGPSYKSSFALLEELKKRRFRNANDKEKSSDVLKKRSDLAVNDDSVDGNVDPMKLAENAMKASTILSNRTEKSLKRATEVLEAVKEHRTPPGNSSESFLMGSKEKIDSISAKLREFSLSSLSFDASANSRNTSDENNDEKDSIDRIIEDRLLAQNNLSTPSSLSTLSSGLYGHAEASAEKKSKPLSTKSKESPSSSDTPSFSSSKSNLEDLDAKYSVSTMLKTVDSHETESSLDDATSSELMRLKSFGEGVESPNNDLLVSKLKLVNPLKDISPIEHHNSRQTAREIGFRSSSRKRKNENVPALKQTNFSDSEIVRLHRSMGAGTVTPLPDMNLDNDISTENNQTLKSSSSFSSVSSFKSLLRKEKQIDEGQFDFKQNELGYQSKPDVTEKVANEVVPEKRFDLESQRIPTRKFDFSSTATSIESSVSQTAESDSGAEVQDSYLSGKSIRRLEVAEPPVPARGIYDIRDSSGPGSTNRKRRELGKKPLEGKDKARDPFTVYVSEQSKSSAASSKLVENGRVGKHARKIASNNHRDHAKKFPESSFSSMSSQSPFLSYSGDELSNDLIAASDLSNRHGDSAPKTQHVSIQDAPAGKTSASFRVSEMYHEDQDYSRKSIYSNNEDQGFTEIQAPSSETGGKNVLITEQDSFAKQQDIVTESRHAADKPSSLRVAWADEPSSRSMPKRTSDFNKLWEKFQERFSPTLASENGDILQKIGVLSEMINDQAVKIPPSLRDETEVKAKSYYSKKENRHSFDNNVYKPRSTNAKKVAATCSKCNKRDIGTNCPTPVPSECEDDYTDSDKPLLLHTWTQTTPNDAGRKNVESNLRRAQLVKEASSEPIHRLYSSDRDKENSHIQANGSPSSNIENGSKISSSWSVTFEPKKAKEQTKIVSSKPPIPLISKADLKSEGKPGNKRREPVFTAWFQSTRSDTSSGTVVPLSEVPILASNFKEKKQTPKMYIGEVNPKETESIVRVGLQEAFKFANEDFIRRSKERVDGVKNAKLHATRRKNLNNLKERHLEEAVVTNIQNFKHSAKTEHLFQPKKRQINKKEMREQNKKLYEKLPEVVRRREEDKRKAQYESNRVRLKQFDKKLRTKLLKLKKI